MPSLKPLLSSLCLATLALFGRPSASAMSVIPPTFSELVGRADTVARVEVTDITSQWDTTSTGKKIIHTFVKCKVLKQMKGEAQTALSLRFLGGQVGNQVMDVPDMPKFVTGEVCIVFVAQNGHVFCPLVGVMYGKYLLTADAAGTEHVRRNNGAALHSTAEIAASDEVSGSSGEAGMGRDEFEAAISTEVHHASVR